MACHGANPHRTALVFASRQKHISTATRTRSSAYVRGAKRHVGCLRNHPDWPMVRMVRWCMCGIRSHNDARHGGGVAWSRPSARIHSQRTLGIRRGLE
eukprot:7379482-Prymnesium_polylepis.3